MTLDPVAALPAVAAAALIYSVSVEAAFYRVYLPVLLLLPDGYFFGWPPFNFHQWAMAPIGLALLWWCINGRWRWSLSDLFVFGFVGWTVASDIHASALTDIASKLATPLTLAIFPYMAGKLLIEQKGLRIAVARRFVFLLFIVTIISAWEFRFSVNPFRVSLGRFFTSVDPWFTQVRYGLGRTSGPFGHAIFMGAILAIAIMLHRYIQHFGLWEKRFRWFPHLRLNKPMIMLAVLIAGSIMTISRGPWISALIGVMIASIGTSPKRTWAFQRTLLILIAGSALLYMGGRAYIVKAKPTSGSQEELESAAYRTKLWAEYGPIAMQQSVWGWGSTDWPKVHGMVSVDNWYLLLFLMYGITGLVLFSLMIGYPTLHLLWAGMLDRDLSGDQRALIFTMVGILVAIGVAIATVFLGGQLFPLLFLFLGWSDACLVYRPGRVVEVPAFAFRRVIA